MLRTRIASALLLVPLVALFVYMGNPFFALLVAIAAAFALHEFSLLLIKQGDRPLRVIGGGATALLHTSRAWAWLSGRDFVTPDDVKALAHATLAHRLGMRPEAELDGTDVQQVLSSALGSVPVPR